MMRVLSLSLGLLLAISTVGGLGVAPVVAQHRLPSHSVGHVPTDRLSSTVKDAAWSAVRGGRGAKAGGAMEKVGLEMALLYYQYKQRGSRGVRSLRDDPGRHAARRKERARDARSRIRPPISADGRSVTVEAVADGAPSQLLRELRRLGLEKGTVVGNLVSGRLPISALRSAAQLSSLRGMVPAAARVHVGSVGSEADTSHSVYEVREQRELFGDGQKICALSDSYNQDASAATTASDDVQSGDLPGTGNPAGHTTPVDVLDDSEPGSDEGRAMLQLIHDLAPEAELGFHTAAGGLGTFVDGIRDLANEGNCTVIVDDVGYNIEPFYQDGPVSNIVDSVAAEGIPYFSSAGNDGQNSYDAEFRNSGNSGVINASSVAHDFEPGSAVDTLQEISIEVDGEFRIFTFQWTDPSAVVEGSVGADTDLDVALVNDTLGVVAESSLNSDLDGNGIPFESLDYTNDGSVDADGDGSSDTTFHLVIEKAAGPDPNRVKYIYSGSGFGVEEYDTLGPTIYGHPMAEGAMAVAAAPFYNTNTYNSNADPAALEPFSSKGGIAIRFDQAGNKLLNPEERQKPDITATDGIDNTFFGTDISDNFFNGVDADPHPNFFGTSAAAPNAAAIAALVRQVRPGFSATEVYNQFESAAVDVTTRQNREGTFVSTAQGFDPWSGHGFVPAQDAVPERDVFDLRLAEMASPQGAYELVWEERSGANIQSYDIERQYFDGPFEPVSGSVESSGDTRSIDVGVLGLGIYTFRIQWTRSDGETGRRTVVDTLGFQNVTAKPQAADEEGRRDVLVSWGVPLGTDGFSYRIERQRGEEGDFETLATTSDTSYTAEHQAPGDYRYRITAVDSRGNTLTSSARQVEIGFEGAAFVFGPYPNPVQEEATLDVTVREAQTVTIEVYNTIGERLFVDRQSLSARTATPIRVNTGRWSSGVYFVRVRGDGFSKPRKFVVVK